MAISMSTIKSEIKNSASSKGKFLYPKEGVEYRIRFLCDLLDGLELEWHNCYKKKINCPCQTIYGRECELCDDEEVRTVKHFCWSVYDYESKEIKILKFAANQCTPVSAFATFYEEYGTLLDRDYKIKQIGSGTGKSFTVVPLAVKKMSKKLKPLSDSAILKYIDKAFPASDTEITDDEDEGEKETKKTAKKGNKGTSKKENKYMNEPDEDTDEGWGEDEEDEELDYDSMTPKELYHLCKERDIDARPKKTKQYYIDLLEQEDSEEWGEDEELPFN